MARLSAFRQNQCKWCCGFCVLLVVVVSVEALPGGGAPAWSLQIHSWAWQQKAAPAPEESTLCANAENRNAIDEPVDEHRQGCARHHYILSCYLVHAILLPSPAISCPHRCAPLAACPRRPSALLVCVDLAQRSHVVQDRDLDWGGAVWCVDGCAGAGFAARPWAGVVQLLLGVDRRFDLAWGAGLIRPGRQCLVQDAPTVISNAHTACPTQTCWQISGA